VALSLVIAILVAVPVTCFANLHVFYQLGAASAHVEVGQAGYWLARRQLFDTILPAWAHSDVYRQPNTLVLGVMGGSFGAASLMLWLRHRVLGFPLHPVGMAVATSGAGVGDIVTAIFAGSLLKGIVLRYGGLPGYHRVLPFFLGLVLGDIVAGMAWAAGGILFDTPTYLFFL
jgi:hypothetical protein